MIASIKDAVVSQAMKLGVLESALRGVAGAPNKARPPWGWFDISERDRPLGEWFFDPANTLLLRPRAPYFPEAAGSRRAAAVNTRVLNRQPCGVFTYSSS